MRDVGPLSQLDLQLPFDADLPQPLILVGTNGSGKTNVLSTAADAIFEAAAAGYNDVLPQSPTGGRSYFRIVGPLTVRRGAKASVSIVSMSEGAGSYFFSEKNGPISGEEARAVVPPPLHPAISWPEDRERMKTTTVTEASSREIFGKGAYCYFPASRSEVPDWLNPSGAPSDQFSLAARYTGQLQRPLFVETGISQFAQWVMAVIVETRSDVLEVPVPVPALDGGGTRPVLLARTTAAEFAKNSATLGAINRVLRIILDEPSANLVWVSRHTPNKIGIAVGNTIRMTSLSSLSAGQATLLNIFGTLLRYADWPRTNLQTVESDVEGICVIDEIDAHMHVDLQYTAVPKLMSLFPKVQFLVSSHSPLLTLGMSALFGERAKIVSLPTGAEIDSEAYSEFGRALQVMKGTRAFRTEVNEAAGQDTTKLLVWLEGETDPIYLTAAAQSLGKVALLERVEFAWIGAKEAGRETNFNSGKAALDSALTFLRANPGRVKRPVLLLYDNDTSRPPLDQEQLHVRSIPTNTSNSIVRAGIENLLPEGVFTEDAFETRTVRKDNGSTVTMTELRKMHLCRSLCEGQVNAENFEGFVTVLEIVEGLAVPPPADPSSTTIVT